MCLWSRYFSWFERGDTPSQSSNFQLSHKLGLNMYFFMHSRGKISKACKLLILQYENKLQSTLWVFSPGWIMSFFSFYHYLTQLLLCSRSFHITIYYTFLLINTRSFPCVPGPVLSPVVRREPRVVCFSVTLLAECLALPFSCTEHPSLTCLNGSHLAYLSEVWNNCNGQWWGNSARLWVPALLPTDWMTLSKELTFSSPLFSYLPGRRNDSMDLVASFVI